VSADLTGRVAVVTGAGQGIGRTFTLALAVAGATVVAADVNEAAAKETVALVEEAGGAGFAVAVDVSDADSTRRLAAEVRDEAGGAHILVNNAAIYHSVRFDPQLTVDIAYWRKVFSVNLDGALLVTQALAPLMIEAGWGRVVNQSSIAAYSGNGGAYAVSKLALLGLTTGFARELGRHGITVNAIAPGPIFTEATEVTVPKDRLERAVAQAAIPLRAQPDDLVGSLLFLCSDAAAWMTGQTLVVDGGVTTRY
jgi:3-oxoacyl-[acyl-carrier protein] reductase